MSDSKIADYTKATTRLQPGYGPTQDFTDPSVGRTAQSPDGIPPAHEGLPGQRFMLGQLPNPEIAIANGIAPVRIPEYLILSDDEAADDTQGPTMHERAGVEEHERLGHPTMAFNGEVMSGEDSVKSLTDLTDPEADRRGVGMDTDNTPEGDDAGKGRTEEGATGDVKSTTTPNSPNPVVADSDSPKA